MEVQNSLNQFESPHEGSFKDHFLEFSHLTMKQRAILIADDLTGACDSGLAFAKLGHSVSIRLFTVVPEVREELGDVVAFSTETRNLRAEEVEGRLVKLGELGRSQDSLLFKKVDSAGRGHAGAEILTLSRLSGCDGIVYGPAFPGAGRTVLDGILRVGDISGQDTKVNLRALFPGSAKDRVALIPVQSDSLSLRNLMMQAHSVGKDIWLCDSETQEDLRRIANAASTLRLRLLWAGSAGLAAAVAELMETKRIVNSEVTEVRASRSALGCTLLFSGTTHSVTLMQLESLAPYASIITLDGAVNLMPSSCGMVQLVWDQSTEEAIRGLWERLHQPGYPVVDSLVLTGGDTTAFVLKALYATSLRIYGEVEPGIPWGVVDDGLAQGCRIITKSGGFGDVNSLKTAAHYCGRLRG